MIAIKRHLIAPRQSNPDKSSQSSSKNHSSKSTAACRFDAPIYGLFVSLYTVGSKIEIGFHIHVVHPYTHAQTRRANSSSGRSRASPLDVIGWGINESRLHLSEAVITKHPPIVRETLSLFPSLSRLLHPLSLTSGFSRAQRRRRRRLSDVPPGTTIRSESFARQPRV